MSRCPAALHAMTGAVGLALLTTTTLLAITLLTAALPAGAKSNGAPEAEASSPAAPLTKGEQALATLLNNRVAGAPVPCIRSPRAQRIKTIAGTAYVYGQGNTIYIQRTTDPAGIDPRDTLVVLRNNPAEICRQDQTTTVDPFTRTFTGVVVFDDFVPYTRVKGETSSHG